MPSAAPQQLLSDSSPPLSPNPPSAVNAATNATARSSHTNLLDETLDSSDDEARPPVASDAFDEQVCGLVTAIT